jgi:hypothetical protein
MTNSAWIKEVREQLCDIHMSCDSMAANSAEMTTFERLQLQKKLKEVIGYIDIRVARKKKL